LGLFHLKWLILVQIQLYFDRNVRQFTNLLLGPQQLHAYKYIYRWRLRAVRSNHSNPPPPTLRAWVISAIRIVGINNRIADISNVTNLW